MVDANAKLHVLNLLKTSMDKVKKCVSCYRGDEFSTLQQFVAQKGPFCSEIQLIVPAYAKYVFCTSN
jgi:hypothetical protein